MLRYLSGALVGCFAVIAAMVAFTVVFSPKSAEIVPETAQLPAPIDPVVVADARAAFNDDLVQAVAPDLPALTVTDEQAVASARMADVLRTLTGDVPDTQAPDAGELVVLDTSAAPTRDQMRAVQPSYFEVWDDLVQRCYATIADQTPLDETGLTPRGDERINYTAPYSEQTWHSADKAFTLKISTRSGDASSGILRTCMLQSNRFALVNANSVRQLKGRFHDWWARERYVQATVAQEYPYTLSDQHKWYGGITQFGSAQGCEMKVEVSEISIGRETDVSLFLTELDREGCEAGPGTGAGGKVRVNRLPQAGN